MVDHVADDFNRADNSSSLGSTSLGSVAWNAVLGTWGIQSNQAYMASVSGAAVATIPTATPEGKVKVDLYVPDTSMLVGLVARFIDVNNFWQLMWDSERVKLTKVVGGVAAPASFDSGAFSYPAGSTYTLELSCAGDDLTVSVDNVALTTVTDSANNTGTDFGLLGTDYADSENARWEDFDLELPQEASVTLTGTATLTGEAAYVLTPGRIERVRVVNGPVNDVVDPSVIRPLQIVRAREVRGPVAPLHPDLRTVITPERIERVRIVRGPQVLPALPPDFEPPPDPTPENPVPDPNWIPIGDTWVPGVMTTSIADSEDESCTPALNDVGSASLTIPGSPPATGATVSFYAFGRRQFVGQVLNTGEAEVSPEEEAGERSTVNVTGHLAEWDQICVLPDFGSQATHRIGRPVQTERFFDWTMNGLGNESFGEVAANIIPSKSLDMIEAVEGNYFPLPDVWPDCFARWMWVTDPRGEQPRGWCHFRVPTPISPLDDAIENVQFWMAAFDYAECWVDGVKILTCDTPGVAQHYELPITRHYHLVTIKAYNAGGKAGVLFSMLPVENGAYRPAVMNSRDGWKSLAYPTRTFVSTPGQVLNRLRFEAARRGAANIAGWSFTFGNLVDSAGRPWDRDETIHLDVGPSYLDALRRLAEDRVDFAADGRALHMWRKGEGSGRSLGASPWTTGVDLLSRDVNREARL